MRARFIIQIAAQDLNFPEPAEIPDFIIDWEQPVPVMAIKFCPFCGKQIDHNNEPLRTKRQ